MATLGAMRIFPLLAAASGLLAAPAKDIHKTVPLPADGRVTVDTYKGSIRVTTWDRPEVQVDVRIEEDFGPFSAPVSFADARIEARGSSVEIESTYNRWKLPFGMGGTPLYHYTIRMPRSARLKIDDYKSESEIDGLAADLEIKTYKGSVRVTGLNGSLRAETYKGDVRADFTRFGGRSSVQTYKGRIDLAIPRGSAFDLRTDLGRKVRFDADFPTTIQTRRGGGRSGVQRVNGGGPELMLESYKGSLRVFER